MQIERTRLITAAQAARASMEENKVPGLAMAFFPEGSRYAPKRSALRIRCATCL